MIMENHSEKPQEAPPAPDPAPAPQATVEPPEPTEPAPAPRPPFYDVHIRVDKRMKERLESAAELAKELRLVEKAKLSDLFDKFIDWGLVILRTELKKKQGYH
jgi:hypothetical protein